jgi:Kef-type K+ transport system membrane component KefB
MTFLFVFLIITFFLLTASKCLERFHVPSIIAMMLVGIVMGPHGLDFIKSFLGVLGRPDKILQVNYAIEVFNILGLIFIMVLAGFEMDPLIVRRERKSISTLSIFSIVATLAAGVAVALYLRLDYIGLILFTSLYCSHSVGIAFTLIKDLRIEKTRFGISILGTTMVADVISIIILSLSVGLKGQASKEAVNGGLSIFSLLNFGQNTVAFISVFLLFITGYVFLSFFVAPGFIRKLASHYKSVTLHSPLFFLLIILIFIFVGEFLGINLVVGAFIAGISISLSRVLHRFEEMDKILSNIGYGIFVPFMFFYIGSQTQIQSLFQVSNLVNTIVICLGLILSKTISGYAAMRISGFDRVQSLSAGLMIVPQLTATLAAADIGRTLNIISQDIFTSVVVMSIVTTIPIPIILQWLMKKYKPSFQYVDIQLPNIPEEQEPVI